jgi:hypothetical protein
MELPKPINNLSNLRNSHQASLTNPKNINLKSIVTVGSLHMKGSRTTTNLIAASSIMMTFAKNTMNIISWQRHYMKLKRLVAW